MTKAKSIKSFLVGLDKFFGVAVVAAVFCWIYVIAHRAIFGLDVWLHLKTGEFILQNGIIPTHDIFSFTVQGKPWIDHSWVFQVFSYLAYNNWGAQGLISLQCYVLSLSFLILFLMGYKKIKSYIEVAIFVFIVAFASVGRFNIRPDIFSMLFFALFLFLLRFHINGKRIYSLIPLQVLWVNIHGYFFLGPLLMIFFIGAEFFRRRINFLPWKWKEGFALSDPIYNRLKKVFLLVTLVCLLNPAGLRGALYPFSVFKDVLLGENQIFFQHIQELKPTFQLGSRFYFIVVIFSFALLAVNFKRLKLIEVILTVFFFLFALRLRNVAFFAFVGYMIIISYIVPTLKKITGNVTIRFKPSARENSYFLLRYALAILLILWLGLRIKKVLYASYYYDFDNKKFASIRSDDIQEKRYPKGAVDFVLANNIRANMLNDFNSGAYLIGRAYPEIKVFIDGRTELYGAEFFKQYKDALEGDLRAFEDIIEKYDIAVILFSFKSANSKITDYIYKDPQWKLVFFDETGIVFLKDLPSNQGLIREYEIDFSKYSPPPADLVSMGIKKRVHPFPYIRRAALLNRFKENDAMILEAEEALRIQPNSAEAYHFIGKAYLYKGLYQEAREKLRAAILLNVRRASEVRLDLAKCLKGLKEYDSAIQLLEWAIKLKRTNAAAYYALGEVYLLKGDEAEAIKALGEALNYAPEEAAYHFRLGEAFFKQGEKSEDSEYIMRAAEEFRKASELNIPEDSALSKKIRHKLQDIRNIRLQF